VVASTGATVVGGTDDGASSVDETADASSLKGAASSADSPDPHADTTNAPATTTASPHQPGSRLAINVSTDRARVIDPTAFLKQTRLPPRHRFAHRSRFAALHEVVYGQLPSSAP
jgi:hypothetical protein